MDSAIFFSVFVLLLRSILYWLLFQIMNPSKLRVDLRLFAELITVGVFTAKVGLPVLASQLTHLLANDKEEHNNLGIIISFCKHCGNDYAGLIPRKYRLVSGHRGHAEIVKQHGISCKIMIQL